MAEVLKRELGLDTELLEGGRGEFTITVNGAEVARKGWLGFPSDEKILTAVRESLAK